MAILFALFICTLSVAFCIENNSEDLVDSHHHHHHHDYPDPTPANNLTLEFVQIVWRHGDRSPIVFYPNDPYLNYWPQIPGMLTQIGMKQHYKLGQFLSKRYMPHFLNPHYLRNETYVISSNIDRAIESAASNLAAFYAPKGWQVFNEGLNWQPVPIHTIPRDEDHFLDVPYFTCPRYQKITDQFHKSEEFQKYNESITPFMEELTRYAGEPITWDNNSFFYDNLVCVQSHGLPLPEWATPDVMSQLKEAGNFLFFNLFRTKEQQKIIGGQLLNSIRNVFSNKIEAKTKAMLANKMVIYSGHDTNLIALTRLLDVFNFIRPPYASAMFFELYSDVNKNYFVKILYRNVTEHHDHVPYELALPLCDGQVYCPWENFFENTSNLIVENWDKECQLTFMEKLGSHHENGHVFRFLVLAVVFILGTFGVFFAIELYCWYIKRRVIDPSKLKLDITFFSSEDVFSPSPDDDVKI